MSTLLKLTVFDCFILIAWSLVFPFGSLGQALLLIKLFSWVFRWINKKYPFRVMVRDLGAGFFSGIALMLIIGLISLGGRI